MSSSFYVAALVRTIFSFICSHPAGLSTEKGTAFKKGWISISMGPYISISRHVNTKYERRKGEKKKIMLDVYLVEVR